MTKPRWLKHAIMVAILAMAAVGVYLVACSNHDTLTFVQVDRDGKQAVMGTSAQLLAVVSPGQEELAQRAIQQAENELRRLEMAMSPYVEGSDVWRLNRAKAGERVLLSVEVVEVLQMGEELSRQTGGALDVTCGALLELWKGADKAATPPTADQIAAAKASIGFDKLQLGDDYAIKKVDGLRVDLSAIAKKYAIDKAVERMKSTGVPGGMVNVGGDLRVFGKHPTRSAWPVEIVDPFDTNEDRNARRTLGTLLVNDAAVVTSGNYERHVTINGKTYSHIVDPRTGQPCDLVPSVTVVGPQAVRGVWATALSVLGWQGHTLLPRDTSAMVIQGTPQQHQQYSDDGFKAMLER